MGTDTFTYQLIFQEISKSSNIINFPYEYGFIFFTKLVSYISLNFYFYLFAVNIVIWFCLFSFLKTYSKDFRLSLWLFLLLGFFDSSMCLVRQFMALSILLLSYKYVIERRFLPFLCVVCLASSFHATSMIFVITYFFWNIKIENKKILLYYLILCISTYLLSDLFFVSIESLGIYSLYLSNSSYGVLESSKIAPILNFLQLFLIVIFCVKYCKYCNDPIIDNMIILMVIASLLTILSFRFTQIGRIASYFSIYIIVLLPNIIRKLPMRSQRNRYTLFFLLMFVVRYVVIAYLRPEWSGVYPYKFFFQ